MDGRIDHGAYKLTPIRISGNVVVRQELYGEEGEPNFAGRWFSRDYNPKRKWEMIGWYVAMRMDNGTISTRNGGFLFGVAEKCGFLEGEAENWTL